MAKLNIRKGDKVKVISGKDRGKEGVVIRVLPSVQRVVVEKVNIVKKHTRPTPGNNRGGIMQMEAPIHVSNVMLVDPKTGEPTRVTRKRNAEGKVVRVSKKSGTEF